MIIVSGEPRSGTSLMMETLRLLGLKIWGEEQPGEERRKLARKKHKKEETFEEQLQRKKIRDMNEKFWEINGIVMRGLKPYTMARNKQNIENDLLLPQEEKDRQIKIINTAIEQYEKHKDHAVKIIWNGIMRTDAEVLKESKIILCLRDPLHIAKSQQRLDTQTKVATVIDGKNVFVSPNQPLTPLRYLQSASQFVNWLNMPGNEEYTILKIVYDDMHFDTEKTIRKIAKFVGVENNEEKIQDAIKNIDPNKRRSANVKEPNEYKEEWILAREIYKSLIEGEYDLVTRRISDYYEFQRKNPANAKWLDEETFFPIDVSLYRSMKEKPNLKDNMLKSKMKREAKGILCSSCPFYNRNGEEYTIELPSDLDDIVRKKIDCKELKKQVTLEECQQHWQSIQYDVKKLRNYNDLNA